MQAMMLEDEPLDVGYAADRVTLHDTGGKAVEVGGQNGTQLLIALPQLDAATASALQEATAELPKTVRLQIILSTADDLQVTTELPVAIDDDEAFGDLYGVRLQNGKLAPALFVVSKDGAIFHEEIVLNPEGTFNTSLLYQKCVAASECYTGKGCH